MHDAVVTVVMYTKAHLARHPIHPMLVAFPVALYVSTVVALLVHVGTGELFWYRVALYANLGGVVMAAIAAVPGTIDLVHLPAASLARATGLRHAALNVLALLLFVACGAVMYANYVGGHELASAGPLALSISGVVATMAAGWQGWKLVQTHHVGVRPTDHSVLRPEASIADLDELFPPPSLGGQPTESHYRH